MPNRALASAFGGIADFLKLQRGLQNETKDRTQKEEAHQAALKAATNADRAAGQTYTINENTIKRLPTTNFFADAEAYGRVGGTEAKHGFVSDPNQPGRPAPSVADSLVKGVTRQMTDEATGRRVAEANADLTEGRVKLQGDELAAFDEAKALGATFDPVNNRAHANLAHRMGKGGMTQLTGGDQIKENALNRSHAVTMQERGISASYGLQAAAQKFQREQYLPDSTPALDAEIERQIRPIEQSANQALAENNAIQARITSARLKKEQNAILLNSGQGTPGMRAEQDQLDAEIARSTQEWNAKVADFDAKSKAVVDMFKDSLRAHPTVLKRVETRLGSAMAGVIKKDAGAAAVEDPNKGKGGFK